MFNSLVKIVLILTSLTPICLVYAWVAITENYYLTAFYLLIATMFLMSACYYLLTIGTKYLETFPFEFTAVEPADQENLSYLLLYLSPLFLDKISNVNLNILVPALAVYALLLASSYTFHFNPLISLMGWHFYKVSAKEGISYVILSKKRINNVDRITKVGQLTGYMLIDLTE